MDAPLPKLGEDIALALAAGATVTAKEDGATAIKSRYDALKKTVRKRLPEASIEDDLVASLESEPASLERRAALAIGLDEKDAAKDADVITLAKELLGLIKVDDAARKAAGDLLEGIEKTLGTLAEIDVEIATDKRPESTKTRAQEPTESRRDLRSSARAIPEAAESKTELERSVLPIHKRTDRFFMKVGILAGAYLAGGLTLWLYLRASPDDAPERCMKGEASQCWQVIAKEDQVEQGRKVPIEPLQVLCETHHDACACAGLIYVNATRSESRVDCEALASVSMLNPKWACSCTRYNFWRWGQQLASHCPQPQCE